MSHEQLVQSLRSGDTYSISSLAPSPGSPALSGWRNREEKLSPVTTLSPLKQRYSSGISRDPQWLTVQTRIWHTSRDSLTILVLNLRLSGWKEEKGPRLQPRMAAGNNSQFLHWSDIKYEALILVSLVICLLSLKTWRDSKKLQRLNFFIQTLEQHCILYLWPGAG